MITGWAWEGAAPGGAACGVSDQEDRARLAAETWLRANPGAVAVLEAARLEDGTRTLSAFWAAWTAGGRPRRSHRLADGRITWARIPAPRAAGAGTG